MIEKIEFEHHTYVVMFKCVNIDSDPECNMYLHLRTYINANYRNFVLKTNNKRWKKIKQWLTSDAIGFECQSLLVFLETNIDHILCFARRIIERFIDMCIFYDVCFYDFTHRLFWSLLLRVAVINRSHWSMKLFRKEDLL